MAYIRAGKVFAEEAQKRLEAFRADLSGMSPDDLYDKHILKSEPCVLTPEGHAAIYKEFNKRWGMPIESLTLVGSSRLGFSTKPKRRYQLFDFNESDIDVAITDSSFFVDLWQDVHVFLEENVEWPYQDRFEQYLVQGWIRPDLLPGEMFKEWFDFFSDVRRTGKSGGIQVRAAIYPSAYFLRSYQASGIADCQKEPSP